MSYNLVDPTTGDLTRVAGNSNIVDTAIETTSTWSSKKISADLANKQDFRIFNSLEEFNKKKGTSLTVVSGIDNMKDIANAMSNGEILIIITKYESGSEVYFGLTIDTGWTKMFTFIKSNGLCDVECRTTSPLTLKRVLNSDGVIGDWQRLCATSVADVPLTHINTFEDESYVKPTGTNLCSYYVTNSHCVIRLETFCFSTTHDFVQIFSGLPKPKDELFSNAIDRNMDKNSGARGIFNLLPSGILRVACNNGDTSIGGPRYLFATFSSQVAET